MVCREITFGSKEFQAELNLRDDLLRKPLGLSIQDDPIHLEDKEIHLGCFEDDALVGVLVLKPLDEQCYGLKMRQVAIRTEFQGYGIGRNLIKHAEEKAKSLGCHYIELHARESTLGFYEKLGYDIVGDVFTEVGIFHRKMEKHFREDKQ